MQRPSPAAASASPLPASLVLSQTLSCLLPHSFLSLEHCPFCLCLINTLICLQNSAQ